MEKKSVKEFIDSYERKKADQKIAMANKSYLQQGIPDSVRRFASHLKKVIKDVKERCTLPLELELKGDSEGIIRSGKYTYQYKVSSERMDLRYHNSRGSDGDSVEPCLAEEKPSSVGDQDSTVIWKHKNGTKFTAEELAESFAVRAIEDWHLI